jgi:uncharacterized protein YbaP (TraB family)
MVYVSGKLVVVLCFFFMAVGVPTYAESSVWKVSGGHATVYLAGSFHLLKPSDYPLPEEFDQAYAQSAKVYFEVLLDAPGQPDLTALVMQHALYADGHGLKDHLRPDVYQSLETYCHSQNVDLKTLDRYRPWMVEAILSLAQMQKAGYDANLGLDRHFMVQAQKDGKATAALESVEEQIGWLASADDEVDNEQVDQMVRDLLQSRSTTDELARAWRTGDLAGLGKILREMDDSPALKKVLVDDRNHRWVPQIEKELAGDQTVLFIVGAGHFPGEDGLLALLQKEGYAVDQL